jgi:GT2 family glycosyltransferase
MGIYRRHHYMEQDRSRPFPVEQPAAACLLLKKAALEAAGGFDEGFRPAWFEDVDLAFRLRQLGLTLWYWPAPVFVHEGGYSAEMMGRANFLVAYWRNARSYYRKHYPLFGRIYAVILPLGAWLRWLVSPRGSPERRAWREIGRRTARPEMTKNE